MLNKNYLLIFFAVCASQVVAQNAQPLSISGSADTYYKYDFSKNPNIQTGFVTDHNSVSIGMLDIALKKNTGKTSFTGEVAFGPRGQYQSIPNGDGTDANSFHIQNLFATYSFTDKFSLTAGYMCTHIGYEVISPVSNFNYSTSYLFTAGPFQNAGVKANWTLSDKVGLMVGLFDDQWNTYKASPKFGVSNLGAQLSIIPLENWNAYLNILTGSVSGTEFDLTTCYQITKQFKLGLNVADYKSSTTGGFSGGALYAQYRWFGVRAEEFKSKPGSGYSFIPNDGSVFALTFSGNIKSGGLTFIPEFRFDNGSAPMFIKSDGAPARKAAQMSLAAVYAF